MNHSIDSADTLSVSALREFSERWLKNDTLAQGALNSLIACQASAAAQVGAADIRTWIQREEDFSLEERKTESGTSVATDRAKDAEIADLRARLAADSVKASDAVCTQITADTKVPECWVCNGVGVEFDDFNQQTPCSNKNCTAKSTETTPGHDMADLTDEQLPGYCHTHCRTERALFHSSHLNRILALAGHPEGYFKTVPEGFHAVHSETMDPLVKLAEERQAATKDAP